MLCREKKISHENPVEFFCLLVKVIEQLDRDSESILSPSNAILLF